MGRNHVGSAGPEGAEDSQRCRPDLTFGPVPSRRLGRSLGINHVPPKVCSYSCIYCQAGPTTRLACEPCAFHPPEELHAAVRDRLATIADHPRPEPVDYLTFVAEGEPTLDAHLGEAIATLRHFGHPVAVLTNGSLLWRADVRAALMRADYVSVKVDTVREATWHALNRPHGGLALDRVLQGVRAFAAAYRGTLTTETMIVDGVNDGEDELRATAGFVGDLDLAVAYIAVPLRPPAEPWVAPPSEEAVARAYEVFHAWQRRVELLLHDGSDGFASTDDAVADLLSIAAVHPMREGAVHRLLDRSGTPRSVLAGLLADGSLVAVRYGPNRYYMRPVTDSGTGAGTRQEARP